MRVQLELWTSVGASKIFIIGSVWKISMILQFLFALVILFRVVSAFDVSFNFKGLCSFDDGVCFECTFSYLMPNVDSMGSKGIINAMQRIGMNL